MEEIELKSLVPSEEMKQTWKIKPTEDKKKKRKFKLNRKSTKLGTTLPHSHKKQKTQKSNYTGALQTSLRFFNAQISGELPGNINVSWRGNSCMQDGNYPESYYKNLAGGYYDGGDAIKSNIPMSFAMTMLSWSVLEYSSNYEAVGELNHVKTLIKWGTDYFLNTFHNSTDTISEMASQIGSGITSEVPNDHYCWMRPEDVDYPRHVALCYVDCPQLPGEMAAALASASLVFADDNVQYSAMLLHGAKSLYKFAESMSRKRGTHGDDELLWGGAWMYYATGDVAYLDRVTSHDLAKRAGAFSFGPRYGVFGLESKLAGTQLLLTRLRLFLGLPYPYEEMLRTFHSQIGRVMCSYLPNYNKFNRTKGGLIQLNHGEPRPLQYAANAAFLAKLFADYLDAANTPGWYCGPDFFLNQVLRDFSTSQIDYILGKNPQNMSYIVGFGERFPKHVHHRGASIPKNEKVSCKGGRKWKESAKDNPNTIQGAMVAGPDKNDGFHDVRANYNYTEPTLIGNVGLVAALVASSGGGGVDPNTIFKAIPPMFPPPAEPSDP